MSVMAVVSLDEYRRTLHRPDAEYVDGVLEERNCGDWDHSGLQTEILGWIRDRALDLGVTAYVSLRTRISDSRIRVPDVVIIRRSDVKRRGILEHAPVVAIEVLAEEDAFLQIQAKIDDYLRIGTRFVWVIDPIARRAWVHTLSSIEEAKDGMLRVDDPPFVVPLNELFANMDRMSE